MAPGNFADLAVDRSSFGTKGVHFKKLKAYFAPLNCSRDCTHRTTNKIIALRAAANPAPVSYIGVRRNIRELVSNCEQKRVQLGKNIEGIFSGVIC